MRFLALTLVLTQLALAWGPRGHYVINRSAVRAIAVDGPVFLKVHEDWIAYWSVIPDSWRGIPDPNSKILEDPNHGWFQEQFSFMKAIPRSRYEFVLALYDEHNRIKAKEPERAALTNVRWTGTMPYAAMESYEHMRIAMRRYRLALKQNPKDPNLKMIELEIASYMGRLGHYTGDSAMPLHDTIHHDGWQGPNPKDYTRDPRVHGRFESQFVELIELQEADVKPLIQPARRVDPWTAIMDHIAASFSHVEEVYQLDKQDAYSNRDHAAARELVYKQIAAGSQLLRDLTHTAWIESDVSTPMNRQNFDPTRNPISPANPRYNPATGSAPAAP